MTLLRPLAIALSVFVLVIVPTFCLFGMVSGFHHHYGFGILPYLVLNGEDPDPTAFQIAGHEIWFDPIRFLITLGLWLFLMRGVRGFYRSLNASLAEDK